MSIRQMKRNTFSALFDGFVDDPLVKALPLHQHIVGKETREVNLTDFCSTFDLLTL